jgi:hypothetical protein
MNGIKHWTFLVLIILIVACDPPKVEDKGRFKNDKTTSTPQLSDLSLASSSSYIKYSKNKIKIGEEVTVVFVSKTSTGEIISKGGLSVSFAVGSSGSSSGNFGTVVDKNNGFYEVSFTATSAGTVNTINTYVDGKLVRGASPSIQIGGEIDFERLLSILRQIKTNTKSNCH